MHPEEVLRQALEDPACGWSAGGFGAIAEFIRTPVEAARVEGLSAVTARGGLRITPRAGLRLYASESPSAARVSLSLPTQACATSGRRVLTELGPDADALRDEDRPALLFDLGLGLMQADACVRSADPALIAVLRAAEGRPMAEAAHAILAASPHRVFVTRLGRVEVFQPIPAPHETSPEGPHTHVLPNLLKLRRTHAATEPAPAGFVPCMHLYPPADRFAPLRERFGDPAINAVVRRVEAALRAGAGPEAVAVPNDRFAKAAVRAVLRRAGDGPVVAAWRERYDTAAVERDAYAH